VTTPAPPPAARPPRRRAGTAAAITLGSALALVAFGLGACSSDGPTAAPTSEAPIVTLPPLDDEDLAAAGGAEPVGGCLDTGGGGSATAPGGSPLAAPGARQLPGPGVTVTSVPSSATSILVQTPGNPDEASPARSPDAVGTPTEPYVIATGDGAGDEDVPEDEATTTTSAAAPDDGVEPVAASGGCGGGL
jgi:hypothetical protein